MKQIAIFLALVLMLGFVATCNRGSNRAGYNHKCSATIQCRDSCILPMIEKLKFALNNPVSREEEVGALTLLCYYGRYFGGLGSDVDLINFPYDDDPPWEQHREEFRVGSSNLSSQFTAVGMKSTPAEIPLVTINDLEYTQVSAKGYEGYQVTLKQNFQDSLQQEMEDYINYDFFLFKKFSRWYYIDKYSRPVYYFIDLGYR